MIGRFSGLTGFDKIASFPGRQRHPHLNRCFLSYDDILEVSLAGSVT